MKQKFISKGISIICVVQDGVLTAVYSTTPDVSVDLLDYDNMAVANLDSEEYQNYQELETRIRSNSYVQIF